MKRNDMPKKIKTAEHIEIKVDSKHSKGAGRKKLKDSGLTEDMMNFAWLIGSGMDERIAGRRLGFSDYKIKSYLDLPKVQEHIAKTKMLRNKEELKEWKGMDDEWRVLVHRKKMQILEGAIDGKISKEQKDMLGLLITEWEKKANAEGFLSSNSSGRVTATQTAIERTTTKELTYEPGNKIDHDPEFNFDDEEKVIDQEDEEEIPFEDDELEEVETRISRLEPMLNRLKCAKEQACEAQTEAERLEEELRKKLKGKCPLCHQRIS